MINVYTGVEESGWPDLSPVFTPRIRRGGQEISALPELQGLMVGGGGKGGNPKENKNALTRAKEQVQGLERNHELLHEDV